MKKKFEIIITCAVILSLALNVVQFLKPPIKIGYVDSKALLNQHPLIPQIQKELNQRKSATEENFKRITDELDSLSNVFVQLKNTDEKVRLARIIDEKRSSAMKYQSEGMKKLRALEEENLKPVLESINLHVKEYAKQNHVNLILGAIPDNIVYADQFLDLTPSLVKIVSTISVAAK